MSASEADALLAAARGLGPEKMVGVDERQRKLVVFTVADELFAFPGPQVREILPLQRIFPLPGAPDFLLGLINVRGEIESVLALERLLQCAPARQGPKNRILLVRSTEGRTGILVQSVEDVVDIPESALKPPLSSLEGAGREFVSGEALYRGRNATILDVGRLLTALQPGR